MCEKCDTVVNFRVLNFRAAQLAPSFKGKNAQKFDTVVIFRSLNFRAAYVWAWRLVGNVSKV